MTLTDTTTATDVTWVTTTRDTPWSMQAPRTLAETAIRSMADFPSVSLRPENRSQVWEGFGFSFNELGWEALKKLSADDRATVFDEFFSPGVGANLTFCRMPVGANDFATSWYSFAEVDGDFELEHFDISRDETGLMAYIKEAKQRQPELRLWASPWSPPAWMKTNGHYAAAVPFPGVGMDTGITPEQVGEEGTDMFRTEPEYLEAYARYFGKFVEAYKAAGIDIEMVMPQNEFNSPQVFPSCTWTPEGLAAFIKVLGPEMERLGVDVFFGTQERPDAELFKAVLADPEAARWIKGLGFQWAGRQAVAEAHRSSPHLKIYQTEQECGDGKNDWRFTRHSWNVMKQFLTNGTSAYAYWNAALESGGVSPWGWAQNSLVVVDPETKRYEFTTEYYLLKHVSHFVRPGAVRIEAFSWSGYENQVAFQNPDGSIVVVVQNDLAQPLPFKVGHGASSFEAELPADSFNTFVLPAGE